MDWTDGAAKLPLIFTREALKLALLTGLVMEIVGAVESKNTVVPFHTCCETGGNPWSPTHTLCKPCVGPTFTVMLEEV